MKNQIADLITAALSTVHAEHNLSITIPESIQIDRTRDRSHGDYASNIALVLSKPTAMQPRKLAELICQSIKPSSDIEKVEIAGPGFINFFLKQSTHHTVIETIFETAEDYGHSEIHSGKKVLIEFVSANPTGPLHVGHGRGAAYGDVVGNLLQAIGYQVDREYYVNDAGRQMDILAASVYLRYLELNGDAVVFPENAYQGDYIRDIARKLQDEYGDSLQHDIHFERQGDTEKDMDSLIARCKTTLGKQYSVVHATGLKTILDDIKSSLTAFGVEFDRWYSEQSLADSEKISTALQELEQGGHLYQQDEAQWFRSAALGDEKDRVVVRDNGEGTYFASDIAYHYDKYLRGYHKIIDIWGADHHGYIARVRAALKALGQGNEQLDILLVQFVSLFRGKDKIQMSTRSGQFVTLDELCEEVGKDATRFFYVMRKSEQHLDFDLELAKSSTKENPVYYIQYAHARICRLAEKLNQTTQAFSSNSALEHLQQLREDKEIELLMTLSKFPETIQKSAEHYEPHNLVYYLKELANDFHTYYDSHRILDTPADLLQARMGLCLAVKQVIHNGLQLLGVSAPETM